MTRKEHLDWCKQRALEYVAAGEATNALASMFSDLSKHNETRERAGIELGLMLMMAGALESEAQVKEFIEGFN